MGTEDEDISSLYRQAPRPEPPGSIDDAILAASRDAVKQPAAARGPFSGGRAAAVSIAAVIVITILLVPLLRKEELDPAPSQPAAPSMLIDASDNGARYTTAPEKRSADLARPASAPVAMEEETPAVMDRAAPAGRMTPGAADERDSGEPLMLKMESGTVPHPAADRSRAKAADSAPFAIYTAEMWEARIAQLIDAGDLDSARAELVQFEQRYPDYTMRADLRDKLE